MRFFCMGESIFLSNENTNKAEKYKILFPQLVSLLSSETDLIANMANISAAIKEFFGFFWVGFYIVKGDQLVLGPFQGPIACTRIGYGKGVCGVAWKEKKNIIVADVDKFPGHIACSSLSKSEVVIPIFKNQDVVAILDVDSDCLNSFDEIDAYWLNEVVKLLNF